MSATTRLGQDESTPTQIAEHLRRCGVDFRPALSDRVDIDEYAQKIGSRAMRFEAWAGGTLVGLAAVYANDPTGEMAFLTSVSVVRDHQGQGVATALLARVIDSTRRKGFKRLALEVERENVAAVRLYTRAGFATGAEQDRMIQMDLELQGSGRMEIEP